MSHENRDQTGGESATANAEEEAGRGDQIMGDFYTTLTVDMTAFDQALEDAKREVRYLITEQMVYAYSSFGYSGEWVTTCNEVGDPLSEPPRAAAAMSRGTRSINLNGVPRG